METPPFVEHRDRSTALIVFGFFEIGLGALSLLLVALVIAAAAMAAVSPAAHAQPRAMVSAVAVYLLAAAASAAQIGQLSAFKWMAIANLLPVLGWLRAVRGYFTKTGSADSAAVSTQT